MSVFFITSGITFLIFCTLFVIFNACAGPFDDRIRPDWKTLTVSCVVGLIGYGISLLF